MNVGTCACGEPITIGDAYKVPVKGPYTIQRPCSGYNCLRVNEVVLTVGITVQKATWKVLTCHCGAPIYLRRDYTGDGNGLWSTKEDKKNRTAIQYCRQCKCRWRFVIRFKEERNQETGLTGSVRHTQPYVRKSKTCLIEE